MKKANVFALALSLTLSYALPNSALAQAYPSKSIRWVIPFSPGGGSDNTARILNGPLSKELGVVVVVDNKPGAGGTIAASEVAHAAPDGYTMFYGTPGQQMVLPHMMKNLTYDPVKGLLAVSQIAEAANVLVVPKNFPAKNVKELIAYAKANPGKVNFSSSGIGGSSHLGGELFKQMAGIDIVHVPYKGSGPSVPDLLSGRVQMTIDTIPVYSGHIKSGALRALGVSTLERNEALPGVPPIADTLPGFRATAVNYISVPAGTPRRIIDRLNKAINAVVKDPEVIARFRATGGTGLKGSTPEEMEALIRSESAKWKKIIEVSGTKL